MAPNMDQPSDRLPMAVGAMSLEEESDLHHANDVMGME